MEKSRKRKVHKKTNGQFLRMKKTFGNLKLKSYVSFYKSIVDQDRAAVVICNLKHEIIYMNPAAVQNYGKRGGDKLIGASLLACHNPESGEKIKRIVNWFSKDESHNIVYTFHNDKQNKDVYMVALRDAGKLIGYYEKHEYRNSETMKPYDLW
jgi:PAS domain-containing protein